MTRIRVDKERLARYFRKSIGTYDQAAAVQLATADDLLLALKECGYEKFETVLEAGCCTGLLTEKLLSEFAINHLFINDLVADFEEILLRRIGTENQHKTISLFGDIEQIELPDSFDMFISSSTLQWLDDARDTITRVCRNVNEGGVIAISFFIQGTLQEVSGFTGIGLQYADPSDIKQSLAGEMDVLWEEVKEYTLRFHTVKEVLRHVQHTGVGGIEPFRWNRKRLADFEQYYSELGEKNRLPLTYKNAVLIAQKR